MYFTRASYAPRFLDRSPWAAFLPKFFSLLSGSKFPLADQLFPPPTPARTAQEGMSCLELLAIKTF